MSYGVDMRIKAIKYLKVCKSKVQVCKAFNICRQTLYNWLDLENQQGNLFPVSNSQKGHPPAIKDDDHFKKHIDSNPDKTQEELAMFFNVSSSTISRTLKRMGYSRKKKVKHIKKGMKLKDKIILIE